VDEVDPMVDGQVRYDAAGSVVVNSLSYDDFRNRLVENFDIIFRQKRVRWPVRNTAR
jgi:hypothetical protein